MGCEPKPCSQSQIEFYDILDNLYIIIENKHVLNHDKSDTDLDDSCMADSTFILSLCTPIQPSPSILYFPNLAISARKIPHFPN